MTIPSMRSGPVALPAVNRAVERPVEHTVERDSRRLAARDETLAQGGQPPARFIQPSLNPEQARRETIAAAPAAPRQQSVPVQPVLDDLGPTQANALRSYLQAQYIDRQTTVAGSELIAGIDIFV
ncbi:MAG: hypothetical protein HKO71_07700 [Pseudomonadales bacterium]|nr:hypothetical protein [Pseudomonadales bacterium]